MLKTGLALSHIETEAIHKPNLGTEIKLQCLYDKNKISQQEKSVFQFLSNFSKTQTFSKDSAFIIYIHICCLFYLLLLIQINTPFIYILIPLYTYIYIHIYIYIIYICIYTHTHIYIIHVYIRKDIVYITTEKLIKTKVLLFKHFQNSNYNRQEQLRLLLKKWENFWTLKLKTLYPGGLNQRLNDIQKLIYCHTHIFVIGSRNITTIKTELLKNVITIYENFPNTHK